MKTAVDSSCPPEAFLTLVDAVLVINLAHRKDRWDAFLSAASGTIPSEKLHRVEAVLGRDLPGFGEKPWFRGRKRDGTWAARGGCVLSHRRALEMAREAGWETVLILEDDVAFSESFSTVGPALGAALSKIRDQWQFCYLAFADPYSPYRRLATLDNRHNLDQVFGCNSAYAYVVKAEARNWILSQLPDEESIWKWLSKCRAVDRWYRRTIGRRFGVVAVSPRLVNHAAGYSDIMRRACDYLSEEDHVMAVPTNNGNVPLFNLRMKLQHLRVATLDVYDALRGWMKRQRGF